MQDKNRTLYIVLIMLAFTVGIVCLFTCNGCKTVALDPQGPYAGDQVLYNTDQTIATAYEVIDSFLRWDRVNQESVPEDVHALAEKIRRDAPAWFRSAIAIRATYVADPTPGNGLALVDAVNLLRTAVTEATHAMVLHGGDIDK